MYLVFKIPSISTGTIRCMRVAKDDSFSTLIQKVLKELFKVRKSATYFFLRELDIFKGFLSSNSLLYMIVSIRK